MVDSSGSSIFIGILSPKKNGQNESWSTLLVRTPTVVGGTFSIDRDCFQKIGTYDAIMEISFRIWQCKETLEIVTCSLVGRVFQKAALYMFLGGTGKIISKNNRLLAEVWMDEFKNFFYVISPGVTKVDDYRDNASRRGLTHKLQYKPLSWYLENISPDSQIPHHCFSLGKI